MSYRRRTSTVIQEAQERITNLKAFEPTLDLGNGISLEVFQEELEATQANLDLYNTKLAEADAARNNFLAQEKALKTLSARMLAGVGVKYGKDSNQYEQAGGTRTSEIKRSRTQPPAPENP